MRSEVILEYTCFIRIADLLYVSGEPRLQWLGCLAYVLFITIDTLYKINDIFGVTVDLVVGRIRTFGDGATCQFGSNQSRVYLATVIPAHIGEGYHGLLTDVIL